MAKINKATLDRYLAGSDLTEDQKKKLVQEFDATGGDRSVLTKAVQLNGRKSMTKVPTIHHK